MSAPEDDDFDLANPESGVLKPLTDVHAPVSPSTTLSALAMNFALKYHDVTIIKDGVLYQQYKMEGRNIRELQLDEVMTTATKFEAWLLAGENRHAEMLRQGIIERFVELSVDLIGSALDNEGPSE